MASHAPRLSIEKSEVINYSKACMQVQAFQIGYRGFVEVLPNLGKRCRILPRVKFNDHQLGPTTSSHFHPPTLSLLFLLLNQNTTTVDICINCGTDFALLAGLV
jgi:hypothetical protein